VLPPSWKNLSILECVFTLRAIRDRRSTSACPRYRSSTITTSSSSICERTRWLRGRTTASGRATPHQVSGWAVFLDACSLGMQGYEIRTFAPDWSELSSKSRLAVLSSRQSCPLIRWKGFQHLGPCRLDSPWIGMSQSTSLGGERRVILQNLIPLNLARSFVFGADPPKHYRRVAHNRTYCNIQLLEPVRMVPTGYTHPVVATVHVRQRPPSPCRADYTARCQSHGVEPLGSVL